MPVLLLILRLNGQAKVHPTGWIRACAGMTKGLNLNRGGFANHRLIHGIATSLRSSQISVGGLHEGNLRYFGGAVDADGEGNGADAAGDVHVYVSELV